MANQTPAIDSLFISPQAGMCNRFRALCTAVILARLSGRQLYQCWAEEPPYAIDIDIVQHMRESNWKTFFIENPTIPHRKIDQSVEIIQVFSEWCSEDFWYQAQSSAIHRSRWSGPVNIERNNADSILNSRSKTVLLETSLCLKPSSFTQVEFSNAMTEVYRENFKPLPIFQEVVDKFSSRKPYVGVHIRRQDHLRHEPKAAISKESWVRIIRHHVDDSEAIYLCSDDEIFSHSVIELLPEYEFVRSDTTFSYSPKLQAFIEFLCLSKATRIFGTIGSSFSSEASRFGGCPFMVCAIDTDEETHTEP